MKIKLKMEENLKFEVLVSLGIIVLIVGVLGNLLTFLSVVVPKIRNKHGFDDSAWLSSTIFVLNLALADIIYCLFNLCMLIHGLLLYHEYVEAASEVCKFFYIGIQDLGAICGWSIALISITQAIPKTK